MFLKDSWISTLKVAMRSSLRDMSKGWYNLYESNWEVYLMSKLRKLMELIKYMLQDTLRFLVQDSLASFSQFLSDACCSVLDCTDDMVWGEDLINSPYRWGPAGQGQLLLARPRWLGLCSQGQDAEQQPVDGGSLRWLLESGERAPRTAVPPRLPGKAPQARACILVTLIHSIFELLS